MTRFDAVVGGSTSFATIASVAALRALTGSVVVANGDNRELLSYYAGLRMGGGLVAYDSADTTTTDDGIFTFVDAAGRRWKRIHEGTHINALWSGCKADDTQNEAPFVAQMIASAGAMGIGELLFPWGAAGVYRFTSKVINQTMMPSGLRFTGVGQFNNIGNWAGIRWRWTGTTPCFDHRDPNGSGTSGSWVWEYLQFVADNAQTGGTMFQFGDMTQLPLSEDGSGQYYKADIAFPNCLFSGGSDANPITNAATGDAIRAIKTFRLEVPQSTIIRGFRRGVWTIGCDETNIGARFDINVQHVWSEASAGFGNSMEIKPRYLGLNYTSGGSNPTHKVHLEGVFGTIIVEPYMEGGCDAALYINAADTKIYDPIFSVAGTAPLNVAVRLGPNAVETKMYNPFSEGTLQNVYDAPANGYRMGYGDNNLNPKLVVYSPSRRLEDVLFTPHPRLTLKSDRNRDQYIPYTSSNGSGGLGFSGVTLTAFNLEQGTPVFGTSYADPVADTNGTNGWTMKLPAYVDPGYSVFAALFVGRDIAATSTVRVAVRHRESGTVTSNALSFLVDKPSGASFMTGNTHSTSYHTDVFYFDMSTETFAAGDRIFLGCLNYSNVDAFVSSISVTVSAGLDFRYASAAPTTGYHAQGEVLYNIAPAASGFIGWACVASGTPGTWKTWGAISA